MGGPPIGRSGTTVWGSGFGRFCAPTALGYDLSVVGRLLTLDIPLPLWHEKDQGLVVLYVSRFE